LFWHALRREASRADWTAGSKSATSKPMIAITTNSSTKVNPSRRIRIMFGSLKLNSNRQNVVSALRSCATGSSALRRG
jgi:hypothetical protein